MFSFFVILFSMTHLTDCLDSFWDFRNLRTITVTHSICHTCVFSTPATSDQKTQREGGGLSQFSFLLRLLIPKSTLAGGRMRLSISKSKQPCTRFASSQMRKTHKKTCCHKYCYLSFFKNPIQGLGCSPILIQRATLLFGLFYIMIIQQ